MSRRLAFARARWPVAVAMRVVAAALAQAGMTASSSATARRSVFTGPRGARRVAAPRDASFGCTASLPRGCEDLH